MKNSMNIAILGLGLAAAASFGQVEIARSVVSAAGGTSTAWGISISCTLGQAAAGGVASGTGTYLAAGFWGGASSEPCPVDCTQDGAIDGDDIICFFGHWDQGALEADINADGGVDGDDIITFFAAWDRGECR